LIKITKVFPAHEKMPKRKEFFETHLSSSMVQRSALKAFRLSNGSLFKQTKILTNFFAFVEMMKTLI
jgi:hypothetical protein